MTKLLIATLAGLVAGLSAAPQAPAPRVADRVAVVADGSDPERLPAARADARARRAVLRAPRTLPEQLAVTTRLAAEGYTTIVGHGLNEHAAIAPLDGAIRYVAAR
jgi:hypothetical protein